MKTAAVLGCGKAREGKEGWAIGHAHGQAYLAAVPDVQLYAVDPNAENLQAFGERFKVPADRLFCSTQALYAAVTPEVVSICTWPKLHHPMVMEAVEAGVQAIICEKPLALDGSEIDAMIATCQRADVRLVVAHQRRYEPQFKKARELLAAGALGESLVLEARVGDGWDMLSWTVHWFDMANYLLDRQPDWVLAGLKHTGERRYGHAVEDASVVFAQYSDGRQAIFLSGPDAPAGSPIVVRGEKGLLRFGAQAVELLTDAGLASIAPEPCEHVAMTGLVADVAKALREGTPTRCDAAEGGATATRMAFAAHESARTLQAVDPNRSVRFAPLEVVQHPPQRKELAPGRVVLLADAHEVNAATGLSGRDGLAEALQALGGEVSLVPAEKRELTDTDLADADTLVLYHTQRQAGADTQRLIGQWLDDGRPLVVAHCGIGAYSDWPAFRQWIGIHWMWGDEAPTPERGSRHPIVPCEVRVTDPQRFAVPWRQAWIPRDEVYANLATVGPVTMLATARTLSDDAPDETPLAWQSQTYPHLAVWAPGHRYDVWQLPVLRDGLAAVLELTHHAAHAQPAVER